MFNDNNQSDNELNSNSFEINGENPLKIFTQNNISSLDENNDEEEYNKIYKAIDYNINNNISGFITNEKTQNVTFTISSTNFININQKKKLGRKRKNSFEQSNRNKFSKDNLIHKFKTIFYQNFLIVLINNLIFSSGLGKDFKIRKVSSNYIKDLTINFNLDILNKTIAEYFSFDLSKIYKNQEKDLNKKIIDKLKSKENYNKLLDKTIDYLYKIFIDDNCVTIINNEFGIDLSGKEKNSLKYFLELEEDPIYRQYLENSCKDIYSFFDKEKARK